MSSSEACGGNPADPMTPPPSSRPLARSLSSSTYTAGPAPSQGLKRKAPCDLILPSQSSRLPSRKLKTARASSQPPLRSRMSKSHENAASELDEDGMPVRYTPTTGRVSKAKKGLPVHYCQYGCGKVYTRAEHRKRHEQNHRKDALFRCTVPDCQKEFQRFDLFQRHLEKQHGQGLALNEHLRASSLEPSMIPSTSPEVSDHLPLQSMDTRVAIGLTTPPYTSTFPAFSMEQATAGSIGWQASQHLPGSLSGQGADEMTGMYEESIRNPLSAMTQLQDNRGRGMSAPPSGAHGEFAASAAQLPSSPASGVWQQTSVWSQPGSMTSTAGVFPGTYGPVDPNQDRPSPSDLGDVGQPSTIAGTNLPGIPGATNHPRMVSLDAEHLQHYHDCYWNHFDPLFPIVHRPSYSPASAESALLGAMMVALGGQFSVRNYSAGHSQEYFELACSMVTNADLRSGCSNVPLATLQGIFLWEYFSLFKSMHQGVHRSQQFVTLYNALIESVGLSGRLDEPGTEEATAGEHEDWVRRESRSRLLAACFILDTYRSTLFHQPTSRPLPPGAQLPRPCPNERWTSSAALWDAQTSSGEISPSAMPFKTAFEQCLSLHFQGTPNAGDPNPYPFCGWALQLASQAPIRSMLILANDNAQLFYQAVTPDEWTVSKSRAQQWIASSDALVDVLYAGKVLNTFFMAYDAFLTGSGIDFPGVGLEAEWCLYISAVAVWIYANLGADDASPEAGQVAGRSSLSPQTGPHATIQPSINALQASADSSIVASSDNIARPYARTQDPNVDAILHLLNVPESSSLTQLRGQHGTSALLVAVRNILMQKINYKSLAIREAVDVLTALIDREEVWGLMA